jgi:hypothetical protein
MLLLRGVVESSFSFRASIFHSCVRGSRFSTIKRVIRIFFDFHHGNILACLHNQVNRVFLWLSSLGEVY